jgi:hypothetical protein
MLMLRLHFVSALVLLLCPALPQAKLIHHLGTLRVFQCRVLLDFDLLIVYFLAHAALITQDRRYNASTVHLNASTKL